ncbi:MAG: HIT family protein [Erysipelotrichia bacterium]|nr:HIT family protein [Erysipelotrichia bacterium]
MKEKCIFCKIVNGEIPSHKIYEDERVLAFLDIAQVTPGHTLVISKKHFDNFLAASKSSVHEVMDVAQRIGQVQVSMLGAKGVNVLTNCYEAAGQSVGHFHVHVIPRYGKEDRLVIEMKSPDDAKLNLPAIADKIKSQL